MGIKTVTCDVCDIEMPAEEAKYDEGSQLFLCYEHYRQRQLDDTRARRKELDDWLAAAHLQLRELDEQISCLEGQHENG